MQDNRSANRGYHLPHADNRLKTDVARIIAALQAVDGDIHQLMTLLGVALNSSEVALVGAPTAPTPGNSENSTRIATTAYVKSIIAALIDSSPDTLDTFKEFADALGNDPNFATTIINQVATKMAIAGGDFTGPITVNGATVWNSDNDGAGSGLDADLVRGAVPMTAHEGALSGGFRNLLINGCFSIWSRASSHTGAGYGSADRWQLYGTSCSMGQSSDLPSVGGVFFSCQVTTDDWGNGFVQKVENGNRFYAGQTLTMSAWVKGPSGKSAAMSVGWVAEGDLFTFTGDWQYIERVVALPSNLSGTSGTDHLHIHPVRAISGATLASGETVLVSRVSVSLGDTTNQGDVFIMRPRSVEELLCLRYYERSNPHTYSWKTLNWSHVNGVIARANNGWSDFFVPFRVIKRATPSIGVYDQSGNGGQLYYEAPGVSNGSVGYTSLDVNPTRIWARASGVPNEGFVAANWEANAEL